MTLKEFYEDRKDQVPDGGGWQVTLIEKFDRGENTGWFAAAIIPDGLLLFKINHPCSLKIWSPEQTAVEGVGQFGSNDLDDDNGEQEVVILKENAGSRIQLVFE